MPQHLLAFALISSVTGFLPVTSPCSRRSNLSVSRMDGRESISINEGDDYELGASEVDLEKVKMFVAQKVDEEQRTVNKVMQREMR